MISQIKRRGKGMVLVVVYRRLGSTHENVKVHKPVRLCMVPRIGDTLVISERRHEVTGVLLTEDLSIPTVIVKPDYRAYKGKEFDSVVQEAIEEGWRTDATPK